MSYKFKVGEEKKIIKCFQDKNLIVDEKIMNLTLDDICKRICTINKIENGEIEIKFIVFKIKKFEDLI